ncbi:VVA0879 family protein [Stenotrophomonas sp. PS02298]|uniref:VVA0879 family protein n=1 Tax=Stenotrophomonas sp. PS02298 TaxID=2991424 RepID=UPI00249A91D2|nr:VVA0879 family protein [Stenotrophomonas sp. PS02298]
MKTLTVSEFRAAIAAQKVDREDIAFICPRCATVQSARSLIAAGAGVDFDSVERYLGFSCIGRFTGAGSARTKPDGAPCNWTLGGLFQLHELEVVTEDGKAHPHFEVATPEQARTIIEAADNV